MRSSISLLILLFVNISAFNLNIPHKTIKVQRTKLNQINNDGYDMSKPVFDLYTLRGVRNDALIRYNSLHQSEPLRINLYLLATITLFSYTSLSEAVLDTNPSIGPTIASIIGGLFTTSRFIRECKRRSKKLVKMEKELNAEGLRIRIANNLFADRAYGTKSIPLGSLKQEKRVLAVCGHKNQLREALIPFRALRYRLKQASTLIVIVPLDGSTSEEWGLNDEEIKSSSIFAKADNVNEWIDYFVYLVENDSFGEDKSQLAWFGLSYSGKSFGSGVGVTIPRPIEILGSVLPPTFDLTDLEEETKSLDDGKAVLQSQADFYDALTTGNLSKLMSTFDEAKEIEVDDVLNNGGRIDTWDTCLEEGARPSNMKTFNSDVLLISDTAAYTTAIECPDTDMNTFSKPTLLAMQRWTKIDDEWKLQLHQTIPWTFDGNFGSGTLICDCRGCTALVKERRPKWSFNGMIN